VREWARGEWCVTTVLMAAVVIARMRTFVVAVTSGITAGNEAAPLDFLYSDILPATRE
jgi:hypothetical protein